MTADIGGTVAPGFESVRDAFAANFETDGETTKGMTAIRAHMLESTVHQGHGRPA